jgi:hypothetical protein
LLVRHTIAVIVLNAGTVTHSIQTVKRADKETTGEEDRTIFFGWDEILEGGYYFIVDVREPDAQVARN